MFGLLILLSFIIVSCNNVPQNPNPPSVQLYDLTFMLDQDTVYKVYEVELDGLMTYPDDPELDGYTFLGWYVDNEPYDEEVVNSWALTLFAHFKSNEVIVPTYSVSFYDSNELLFSTSIPHNEIIDDSSIDTTKNHYSFDGWFIDSELEIFYDVDVIPITANLNLYGKWTANKYTINLYSDEVLFNSLTVTYPNKFVSPNTKISGFIFEGWYTDKYLLNEYDNSNLIENSFDLYGKWIVDELDDSGDYEYTGYYETLNGLSGTDLKYELRDIITTTSNNTTITYGEVRYALEIADEWPLGSGKVILIYNGATSNNVWDGGATWEREHVFPSSKLSDTRPNNSTRGITADAHNLRAINRSVNSSRGNKPFHETADGHFGAVITGPYAGSYDPGLDDRGDVARIIFYMLLRWPSTKMSDIGVLETFIKWHNEDPVSDFEIHRNNVIYDWQGNRNPFIDHKELVERIPWS